MKSKKKKIQKDEQLEKIEEFENLSSFFDKYISNGQLIMKYATLFDLQRIKYVKGKDVKLFFNNNFEEIQKKILEIAKVNIGKEANKDSLQKFYDVIRDYDIMHYLKKIPGDKTKYPKRLLPLTKEDDDNLDIIFNESGFYLLQIKVEKSNKPIIYLALLIILILFIVLFPIWPLNMKIWVLYLLLASMIFLIVFLVLTIIVSIIGALFGYDICILPNLDESKLSWRDRFFNPFVEIAKREDPCWCLVIRIILIISIVVGCIFCYFFPRLPKRFFNLIKTSLVYVFSYGKQKIEDIHYHRNDMTVSDGTQFLDDLDGI